MSACCKDYPYCKKDPLTGFCVRNTADMIETLENEIKRDDKGYPLKSDGTIDWEKTSEEKQVVLDQENDRLRRESGIKKVRRKNTNRIPPKKKRK